MSVEDLLAHALHESLGSLVELDVCESVAAQLLPFVQLLAVAAGSEALVSAARAVADEKRRRGPYAMADWLLDRAQDVRKSGQVLLP